MDPISFGASLTTVIQLSATVAQFLKEIKSGSEDRVRLREEIRATLCLLDMLQDRLDDADVLGKDLASIRSLDLPEGPLDQLAKALQQLKSKLSSGGRLLKVSKTLLWPLSKEEVNDLINTIERQKTAFNLAISNDNIALSLAIKTHVSELNDKVTAMEIRQEESHEKMMNQEDDEIITWLSPLAFWARQQDILSTRTEDTGRWLFETTEFQSWQSGLNNVLWCHGIPGAGKTVLTSIIVESLEQAHTGSANAIGFIYCNYKERAQQSCDNLISSLIRQLIVRGSSVPDELRSLYNRNQNQARRPSRSELLELLSNVASRFSSLFFVIDALDECDDNDGARSMLTSGLMKRLPDAHFLYTSRRLSDIEHTFADCSQLEIRASDRDVRRYIESRISDEPRLAKHTAADPGLLPQILDTIIQRSDGMFLLAQLHLGALATKHTRKAVRSSLQSLPSELNATYNEALQRIYDQSKDDASLAEHVLMWVSHATTPLTVIELQHAVAAMGSEIGMELDDEDTPDEEILLSVCAGIVLVDKESNLVRLVHYTAQEYFEKNPLLDRDIALKNITEACITYLSQDAFDQGPCDDPEALRYRLKRYPFIFYAAQNWGKHAQGPPEDLCRQSILGYLQNEKLNASALQVSSVGIHVDYMDERPGWAQRYCRNVPVLARAANFGLAKLIRHLLEDGRDVDASDSTGATALHWAAAAGDINTINILLAAGADTNKIDICGESALIKAVMSIQYEAVATLIRNGANVNQRTSHGDDALSCAFNYESNSIVRLLLDNGAIIEAQDGVHDTVHNEDMGYVEKVAKGEKIRKVGNAILWAIMNQMRYGCDPSIEIMELSAEKGADLSHTFYGKETAIHMAARYGLPKIVKFLLNRGVDPNSRTDDGHTPLHWATSCGNLEVTQLLLRSGANIAVRNGVGETVLHTSCHHNPDDDIVTFLLAHGSSLNMVDDRVKTVLHEAAYRGHSSIVNILINNGASVDAKDNQGWTPLLYAAACGEEDVIDRCLESCSIHDHPNYERLLKGAHLRRAAAIKDDLVVQRLLEDPNLDVTVPDYQGTTTLHHAAYNGDTNIVSFLLERGASVNARIADSAFQNWIENSTGIPYRALASQWITPLHFAAGRGHVKITEVLLKHGADMDARAEPDGFKPLSSAARDGQVSVMELLLDHGAEISETNGPDDLTPLFWAVDHDSEDAVRLLLERGADKERGTRVGREALAGAYKSHQLPIVKLLTSYGFQTDGTW